MFRKREKEKKMPLRNHNSIRRGLNDTPYMMITSPKKKGGLNLKKSTWEYGFSCFMTLVKIKVIKKKKERNKPLYCSPSLFPAPEK